MGICKAEVSLLATEAERCAFQGTVATLGRQHVYVTENEARSMLKSLASSQRAQFELHREPALAARRYISDDSLLKALGFERSLRIDVDNYEQVDIILDLNTAETPPALIGQFDAIFDFGTLEHVFHVPNALAHIAQMLVPGGRVVHFLPASNCVEHGFYSFSPTFARDHYLAAGFTINTMFVCRLPQRFERGRWTLYRYPLDYRGTLPMGRLGRGIFALFVIATAPHQPVLRATPQQGAYERIWSDSSPSVKPPEGGGERLIRLASRWSGTERSAKSLVALWRGLRQAVARRREGAVPFEKIGRV